MKEPVRFSWRHWWNYIFIIILSGGLVLWRFYGLDGRIVLFVLAGWLVFGRIFVPSIIFEHVGFLDRRLFHDYDKANQRYRRAINTGKATAQAYCVLASLSFAEGDTADAAMLLEEAISRLPRDVYAHALLARVLTRMGRYKEAVASALRCLEISNRSALSYMVLGEALKEKGDLPAAVSAYQKALEISPSAAECRLKLGEIYYSQGDLEAAEEEFNKAFEISPYNPDVLYWRGKMALHKGDVQKAKIYLQKSLENRALNDYTYFVPYEEVVASLGDLAKVSR